MTADKAHDTTGAGPLDAAQVDRLNITARCDTDSAMRHFAYAYTEQSPEGDYVRYSDYAALSQQLADARTEVNVMKHDWCLRLSYALGAISWFDENDNYRTSDQMFDFLVLRAKNDRHTAADDKRQAEAEIARCHARLEIDHHFVMIDGAGLERRETPIEERASRPDAVSARDETIKLLDKRIARFEAEAEPPASMDMFGDDEWRFSK